MIAGLLNQRLRLYAYVEADDEGVITPAYQFTVEVWGRIEDVTPRERVKSGAAQDEADAQLVCSNSHAIPARGIVTTEDGSEAYRIVGRSRRRGLWLQAVRLARAEDDFDTRES